MMYFGEVVVGKQVMHKGKCHKHHFCGICGKELTRINYERGFLTQERHLLITLANGVQFRKCWNSTICEQRRGLKQCLKN